MRKRKPMKITIELTPDEQRYLTMCCIGRVAKSALLAVPTDYEHWEDLEELIEIVEPLRSRLCNEIFKEDMKLDAAEVTVIHHGGDSGKE